METCVNDPLVEYVIASRGDEALRRVTKTQASHYATVIDHIGALIRDLGFPTGHIRFAAVDRFEARAETVGIGDTTCILYDHFLGRSLSRFAALMDEDHDIEVLNLCLSHVYSSVVLYNGRPRAAFELALYHRRRLAMGARLPESDDPTIWQRQLLMEAFIIAHEMIHAVMNAEPDVGGKVASAYYENLSHGSAYFMTRVDSEDEDDAREARQAGDDIMRADWVRAIERAFGTSPSAEDADQFMSNFKANRLQTTPIQDANEVLSDFSLLEECICDAMAADLVGRLAAQIGSAYELGVRESWTAMHFVRMIRLAALYAHDDVESDDSERPGGRADTLIRHMGTDLRRFQVFRYATCCAFARGAPQAENFLALKTLPNHGLLDYEKALLVESFNQGLAKINQRFWAAIGDHTDIFSGTAIMEVEHLRHELGDSILDRLPILEIVALTRLLIDPPIPALPPQSPASPEGADTQTPERDQFSSSESEVN